MIKKDSIAKQKTAFELKVIKSLELARMSMPSMSLYRHASIPSLIRLDKQVWCNINYLKSNGSSCLAADHDHEEAKENRCEPLWVSLAGGLGWAIGCLVYCLLLACNG
ncbi:MAG: hypothetical protein P8L18_00595 [Verrucomicrobiota bacterium]|jgi:hypothetical protein|nr:hypothetical protein [Verrucomicrobiota bacterium]